jgi:hypothetical protein
VHLYGIQETEFIIRYQINHSPHDNEIGDLGNIGIVALCQADPLRRSALEIFGTKSQENNLDPIKRFPLNGAISPRMRSHYLKIGPFCGKFRQKTLKDSEELDE